MKDIAPQVLKDRLEQVHIIDVNEADNYAFAHVPGAKLLLYDAITAELLPADKSSTLVFYCWSPECPAAGMAAGTAVGLGFTDVYCMQAGITGWQDAGLPTEP
ncbi:MAG: rhodanese-like domain-containing protein [Flavobacteriales bacterium]|nr:MAG: rhodanese-like domain-containing protein [Flavobacteriales bacterium]